MSATTAPSSCGTGTFDARSAEIAKEDHGKNQGGRPRDCAKVHGASFQVHDTPALAARVEGVAKKRWAAVDGGVEEWRRKAASRGAPSRMLAAAPASHALGPRKTVARSQRPAAIRTTMRYLEERVRVRKLGGRNAAIELAIDWVTRRAGMMRFLSTFHGARHRNPVVVPVHPRDIRNEGDHQRGQCGECHKDVGGRPVLAPRDDAPGNLLEMLHAVEQTAVGRKPSR